MPFASAVPSCAVLAGAPAAPLHLNLQLARLGKADTRRTCLRDLQLRVDGSNTRHSLQASVARSQHQLTLSADGGFDGAPTAGRWRGQLLTAELQAEDAARNFRLNAPAALAISPQAWQFGPAQLVGTPLDWRRQRSTPAPTAAPCAPGSPAGAAASARSMASWSPPLRHPGRWPTTSPGGGPAGH